MSLGSTPTRRLQAAFYDACFGVDSDVALRGDLRAYLARHGVAPDDIAALVAAPRRLGLYRQLIRGSVVSVIRMMLERTIAHLDARTPGAFSRAVDGFLSEVGPRTPHLRDVPSEFLSWAKPRWEKDAQVADWLLDHAEFELAEFTIATAPRPGPTPPLAEVAPDRPLVFAEPWRLLRLAHAAHTIGHEDFTGAPEKKASTLLVYRDPEHAARFLDLSPLAAAILERLLAGQPLAPSVADACAHTGEAITPEVLGGAAQLLADLGERGVLLGARD